MDRRNFLKAIGLAPAALMAGKAMAAEETVQEHMERVTREYRGGPEMDAAMKAEFESRFFVKDDNLFFEFPNTTFRKTIVHYDLGIRRYYVNPKLRKS